MSKDWIAVADKARCRIFRQNGRSNPIEEIADLVSPITRLKNREINADRQGRRTFDSAGQGRHAVGGVLEPIEQEAIRFAKEVVETLESGRKQGSFDRLYLVAEPRFLGYLRQSFTRPLKDLIAVEIGKDWTSQPAEEIRTRLRTATFG